VEVEDFYTLLLLGRSRDTDEDKITVSTCYQEIGMRNVVLVCVTVACAPHIITIPSFVKIMGFEGRLNWWRLKYFTPCY
jgi:hypothetical protein